MQKVAIKTLGKLPRAFESEQGLVDTSLLKKIIDPFTQRPSGAIKSLLQIQKCNKGDQSKIDVYEALSQEISKPIFRERWYQFWYEREKKNNHNSMQRRNEKQRQAIPAPLFSVVRQWLNKNNILKEMDLSPPKYFTENRSGQKTIKAECIVELCEYLSSLGKHSTRDAALFAWSIFEESIWLFISRQGDESLHSIRWLLIEELKHRGEYALLDLLDDAAFDSKEGESLTEPILANGEVGNSEKKIGIENTVIRIEVEPVEPVEPECARNLNVFCSQKLEDINLLMKEVVGRHKSTSEAVAGLLHFEETSDKFSRLLEGIAYVQQSIESLNGIASTIESQISSSFVDAMQGLAIRLDAISFPKFSIPTFEKWQEAVLAQKSTVIEVLRAVDSLRRFDVDIISRIATVRQNGTISLNDAVWHIQTIEGEVANLSLGMGEKNNLHEILTKREGDFAWNPFLDDGIRPETWTNLARYLLADGSMPLVLGLCVRKHFEHLKGGVEKLIDDIGNRPDVEFDAAFLVLSGMTVSQIDRLRCSTVGGRVVIASFLFESFLRRIDALPTDAFSFLSADPLRDFLNEQDSSAVGRFFSSVNDVCTRENGSLVSVNDLHRLVTEATPTASSSRDMASDALRTRLLHLLEIHRGGGRSYAKLRELAYEEICQPLRASAENGSLEEVVPLYRKIRGAFNFDDHLPTWRKIIPPHRKKETDYIHQTRLWVRDKFDELDKWAHEFETTRPSVVYAVEEDEGIHSLKRIISEVMVERDPGCRVLRQWFITLAKLPKSRASDRIPIWNGQGPSFENSFPLKYESIDPFYPRSYRSAVDGRGPRVADFLADELFASFGLYQPDFLANIYVKQRQFELFKALRVSSRAEFDLNLVREVESAENTLEGQYLLRITAVYDSAKILSAQNADLINLELEGVKVLLNNQRWIRVESDLSGAERACDAMLLEEKDERYVQRLIDEILALGGSLPTDRIRSHVEAEHMKTLSQSAPRRKHLDRFTAVISNQNLSEKVRAATIECLESLRRPDRLPEPEHSAFVDLTFSSTVDVLFEQLQHSHFYSKTHKAALDNLVVATLASLNLHGVNEGSPAIQLLLQFEPNWTRLRDSEQSVLELLRCYPTPNYDAKVAPAVSVPVAVLSSGPGARSFLVEDDGGPQDDAIVFSAFVDRLAEALSKITIVLEGYEPVEGHVGLAGNKTHAQLAIHSYRRYKELGGGKNAAAIGHLTDCTVAVLKVDQTLLSTEEHATSLHLINSYPDSESVRSMFQPRSSKGKAQTPFSDFVFNFFGRLAKDCSIDSKDNLVEQILVLSAEIDRLITRKDLVRLVLSPVGRIEPLMLKNTWDSLTGDLKQAETRAALMNILWRCSARTALACCFRYSPIDIESRTANALSDIAEKALSNGNGELLHSFVDLKRTVTGKPFEIFVNLLLAKMPTNEDLPAQIKLVGTLDRINNTGLLSGVLCVKPRKRDSPNTLIIKMPKTSPLAFEGGSLLHELEGPFIRGEELLSIHFQLIENLAVKFTLQVECEAFSITGQKSKFSTSFDVEIAGADAYDGLTAEEISVAFNHFQAGQVRGLDYISRPDDEKRILDDVIHSKTVRSIWITSPRRSGKTTMLYWILDAYSQNVGRDFLVAYFSLSRSFDTTTSFNGWIWNSLLHLSDNSTLKSLVPGLSEMGKTLPFDADAGVFIEAVSNLYLNITRSHRIIFLFDEIDKFATMYFSGDPYKKTAMDIVWSLRQLMQRRGDIGFVFAGSSATKKIFLTDASAPFFNYGIHYELTPFSCDSQEKEKLALNIVEPAKLRGKLTIPKDSLKHILWLCSGIPYYMKLVAGATFAVSRQSHVLKTDIGAGLNALLKKKTGISRLDAVEGAQGSDELSTIPLAKGVDRTLVLAVLYAMAELESPVNGHPIRRAKLYGDSSPLVARYQISRKAIEIGLDKAIELGLFRLTSDVPPHIIFTMPLLGESIRSSIGTYWPDITHELEKISANPEFLK